MVMPQRDDPPSRCALRRTGTIEAIKRLATLPADQQEPARKEWAILFSSLPLGALIKHLVLPQGAR